VSIDSSSSDLSSEGYGFATPEASTGSQRSPWAYASEHGLLSPGRVGIVCRQTAAQLWGFTGFEDPKVDETTHVTLDHGRLRARDDNVVLHTTRHPSDWRLRSGVPVTKPLRTVLDLSVEQEVSDTELESFISHCVSQRFLTTESIYEFAVNGSRGMAGVGRLRKTVMSMAAVDSIVEAQVLKLISEAGIEVPETRFEIRKDGRLVVRLDLAWPRLLVCLEVDGFLHHSDHESFVKDRYRGNLVASLGWLLLRTTKETASRRPETLLGQVARTLAIAEARLSAAS
jgi:hypothetical protein